jgi:WD40 repeat protein
MQLSVVLKTERKCLIFLLIIYNLDTDIVPAITWAPDCQLYTCSDDKVICKWNSEGELVGKISSLSTHVTSISWLPVVGKQV